MTAPVRHSAIVYTHDFRIPLSDDDREMECGWRCVPIPPTDVDEWVIVDASRDYKTGWSLAQLWLRDGGRA